MAKKKNPELRMYFLVCYNISGIQQGIQSLHAAIEYSLKYGKDKEYIEWAKTHKTVIILNGGTSNDGTQSIYGYPAQQGSMEQHFQTLKDNKIKCAAFREPDLNYAMSSVAFLVDERVFNKKDYPDVDLSEIKEKDYPPSKKHYEVGIAMAKAGFARRVGKDVAFLKEFLKPFRMA